MSSELNRRVFVARSAIMGAGAALSLPLGGASAPAGGAESPAARQAPAARPGGLPMGKIGNLNVSRLVLGGSPLQHYVHARDLAFVHSLMAHYNTPAKILETLALAEQRGINTVVAHPSGPAGNTLALLKRHREKHGGKMQWIIAPQEPIETGLARYGDRVQKLVDDGADAIYVWGVQADALASRGQADAIARAVDLIKPHGIPCGVGAHWLGVIEACQKNKIPADFYIKTLHHHRYPSAGLNYDSSWCTNPEETIALMKGVAQPWIAFKVLAAGAIPPADGFRYAFANGADFVLAGMYDFEIAADVRIAAETLGRIGQRPRTLARMSGHPRSQWQFPNLHRPKHPRGCRQRRS